MQVRPGEAEVAAVNQFKEVQEVSWMAGENRTEGKGTDEEKELGVKEEGRLLWSWSCRPSGESRYEESSSEEAFLLEPCGRDGSTGGGL